jgi:protein ImuB
MTNDCFACIFVPDFPVEARLRVEPDLRSQAVVVLEGTVPLQRVFAVNEKARHAGVEPGMSKIQIESCSGLALRARSLLQETAAHAALLDSAQSFSPKIEDAGRDTILLDLNGLEMLFGSPVKIAREMARRTSNLGLEANVAIASNPESALLAAHGFTGVTVIPSGKEAERLGNLSIDVLFGLPDFGKEQTMEQFLETFHRWGVRNLRALAVLPKIAISERLGQAGVRLQQLAGGATTRTLVPVEPPFFFEEVMELDYPVVLLEPLAFLLSHLVEQLCRRLSTRALCTQELRLELQLDPSVHLDEAEADGMQTGARPRPAPASFSYQRTLQLPVPLLDPRVFLKLLQLDLNAHPPGAPIVKIRLAAEPARPRAAQGGLFLPPSPDPEKLEVTLARIAGIVGEGKVGSLAVLDTHRPEAFRMQHFAPRPPDENHRAIPETRNAITALRIFRPSVVASVMLRDGKPVHVLCPKRKELGGEVLWTAGPWRSSGDWWGQDGWARDEWDIALQNDNRIALYRLVRDLLGGQWWVEGTYD